MGSVIETEHLHSPGGPSGGTPAGITVHVDSVTKTFVGAQADVCALDDVSLEVREREFLSLVGPSGCGKSTLLRLLANLDRPSQGRIQLSFRAGHRSQVAVAFQDYSILPWKTVEGNVAFGLRMQGQSRRPALETARAWITKMNLGGFERSYPDQLSGGMKQRVALARALALDPALLLLDEPFAALDAQMRQVLQEDLLSQWEDDQSRTAVLVTHDLDEAILLSDRVALMSARPGRIRQIFEVPLPRPRTPEIRYAQAFVELRQEIWECLREEVAPTAPTAPTGGA